VTTEADTAEEFIYVDLSSVDHNVIESLKRIKGSEAPSRARRVIRENDVILSTVRPTSEDMQ
jgi:type I restriction enzyme, S subunit